MPVKAVKLIAREHSLAIERGPGEIEVRLPLSLGTWDLAAWAEEHGQRPVVVKSDDLDYYVGVIAGVSQERFSVTVRLT